MNLLKSLYISAYSSAAVIGTIMAIWQMTSAGLLSPWLGAALACGSPTLFFAKVFLTPTPRTSANLYPMLVVGLLGAALAAGLAGGLTGGGVWLALVMGQLANPLYVFWYSRFDAAPADSPLKPGQTLPELSLREAGKTLSTSELTAKPALWIFYRGNWCPLCMAQIKEIAAQYRQLAERGVEVYLISPQPEENSQSLSKKFDAPMHFLTDPDNAAAKKLGVLNKAGLPAGFQVLGYESDVPRPTVFITDAQGKIIFVDVTDNYRVRPEPAQYFDVLDQRISA